jgi:hypothetical protein
MTIKDPFIAELNYGTELRGRDNFAAFLNEL